MTAAPVPAFSADHNTAISDLEQALGISGTGLAQHATDATRWVQLGGLGHLYLTRFNSEGSPSDIRHAYRIAVLLVSDVPAGLEANWRATGIIFFAEVTLSIHHRPYIHESLEDLRWLSTFDVAVLRLRILVDSQSDFAYLDNAVQVEATEMLAFCLRAQFDKKAKSNPRDAEQARDDICRAVRLHHDLATEEAATGQPEKLAYIANAAGTARVGWSHGIAFPMGPYTGPTDIIQHLYQVEARLPPTNPAYGTSMLDLALLLGDQSDCPYGDVSRRYAAATRSQSIPAFLRLSAAMKWTAFASKHLAQFLVSASSTSSLQSYAFLEDYFASWKHQADALQNFVSPRLTLGERMQAIRAYAQQGVEGLGVFFAAGEYERGVRMLERVRNILWGHLSTTRHAVHDNFSGSFISDLQSWLTTPLRVVVVVNATELLPHALVIKGGGSPPEAISLPSLSKESAKHYSEKWSTLLASRSTPEHPSRQQVEAQLLQVLGWLWDAAIGPLRNSLGLAEQDALPLRIWWCVSGILSQLPIHAARDKSTGSCMLDCAVSSYTPSLQQLRTDAQSTASPARGCFVVTPDASNLPGATDEQESIVEILNEAQTPPRVYTPEMSKTNILQECKNSNIFVFVGHATQDRSFAFRSRLKLSENCDISLEDIAGLLATERSSLAYISACEGAAGSSVLPDETLHLAGALQTAKFKSVIGTLWTVYDQECLMISRKFWSELVSEDGINVGGAADALRIAVLQGPVGWYHRAAFVHIGL